VEFLERAIFPNFFGPQKHRNSMFFTRLQHRPACNVTIPNPPDPMNHVKICKGGPEPLEKESHEFLGSKRDDRFSNPFFEMVPKTCHGSFFVPALA